MRTAIVDIDGTISDSRHRLHHVRPPEGVSRDYAAFHSKCHQDPVIGSMRVLVHALCNEGQVVLCTGRPEEHREATMNWLDDNDVPYDQLFMRPTGDSTPAPDYKLGVLRTLQERGHKVFLAIEDQQKVVDMWRANGIHCLQTVAI